MGGNLSDDLIIRFTLIAKGQKACLPLFDDDASDHFQPTVHGVCPTDFTVNAREDIATDVTVNRDLSKCDSFFARRQDTSPLALITGMVKR